MILKEAKALKRGDIVYHKTQRNADGTPVRWRVNGRNKLSPTSERVKIPVKHGLYDYDYITEDNMADLELNEEDALQDS